MEIAFHGDLRVDEVLEGFAALAAANDDRAKRGVLDLAGVSRIELSIDDLHRIARARNFPSLSEYRVAVAVPKGPVETEVRQFLTVNEFLAVPSASQIPAFRVFETADEARAWAKRGELPTPREPATDEATSSNAD